jgi:hypothetical protein
MDEKNKPTGVGCPHPDGYEDVSIADEVYTLLRLGSARLALARAMCIPFQPTASSVCALFGSTSDTDLDNIGTDPISQFTQDTLIEGIDYTIVNKSETANSNIAQPWSDYYYSLQSGIKATLQIGKAPFYGVFPVMTPLSTILRAVKADTKWPRGWVLGKTQQITMSFHASVALPVAPLEVTVTFLGKIPTTGMFLDGNMSKAEALDQLEGYGYRVKPYRDYLCR